MVPGARVKFDAPPSARVALTNRDQHADLSRAKKYLGFAPEFPLREAVKVVKEGKPALIDVVCQMR